MSRRFADARCFNCGGFTHRAADCAVIKRAQMFNAAGVEINEDETGIVWEELLHD
jgi:hypothetical protein